MADILPKSKLDSTVVSELETVFNSFNSSGNGFLSRADFSSFCETNGITLNREESRSIFNDIADENEGISFDDFVYNWFLKSSDNSLEESSGLMEFRNSLNGLEEEMLNKRCPSRSRFMSSPDFTSTLPRRQRSATSVNPNITRIYSNDMYYKRHPRDRVRGPIQKEDLKQKFYSRTLDFQTAEICTGVDLFENADDAFFSLLDGEGEWDFVLQICLLDDHFYFTKTQPRRLPVGEYEERSFMAQSAYELNAAMEIKGSDLAEILEDCSQYLPEDHPLVWLAENEIDIREGALLSLQNFKLKGIGESQMLMLENLYFSSLPYLSDDVLEPIRVKLSRLYYRRAIVMSRLRGALENNIAISDSDLDKLKTAFPEDHPAMVLASGM